jgi:hypothetical protein
MSDEIKKEPWYMSKKVLVMTFVAVGPLALPLLWMNPKISMFYKVLWTVVTIAVTWWLVVVSIEAYQKLMQQLKELGLLQTG